MTKIDNRVLYFPKDFKKDKNDIWVQQKYNLDHSSLEGDTPLCLRKTNMTRLFNSLDFSSLIRFWISTNWMKEQFVRTKNKHPRVLDLGCANLQAYHIWHNNGNYFGWPSIKYYGVDVNYKRLMVGKNLFKFKKSDQVTLIQANLEHPIIFKDESEIPKTIKFDFVVCMEFLEHIPKESFATIMNTLNKFQLKKDGRAILSSPNPNKEKGQEVVWKKMSPISHVFERSYPEAEKLILDSGLEIEDKAATLARGNYRSIAKPECKDVRKRMMKFLPTSIVNNLVCLADDVMSGGQWIIKVKRKNK